MYGAYALRSVLGQDVAVAVQGNGTILGIGSDARVGAGDVATPVVNLLQFHNNMGGQYDICVTYPPTEACLGIAKIRRVRSVYEFTAAGLQRRLLNGPPLWHLGGLPGVMPMTPGAPIPGFAALNAAARSTAAARMFNPIASAAMPVQNRTIRMALFNAVPCGRNAPAVPAIVLPPPGYAGGGITPFRRRLFLTLAHALVRARHAAGQGGAGHAVGCVVVDNTGMILGCSVNSVGANSTYHAETLAVIQYSNAHGFAGLPNGCNIFTTLQCCYMCAGVISEACANAVVYFGMQDIAMPNNALARQVNGCSEQQRDYVNFNNQLRSALGNGWNTIINSVNSPTGALFAAEAIHQLRRMEHEASPADTALWTQCQGIINTIHPNLV